MPRSRERKPSSEGLWAANQQYQPAAIDLIFNL